MKLLRLITLTAMALAVAAPVPSAYGQDKPNLTVQIPFEFVARGRTFQAGTYTFASRQGSIALTSAAGKELLAMQIVTSLARSSPADDHLLAFDKVHGKRILSEVWLPNRAGALVSSERGEHDHDIIRMVPKARS